MDRRQMIGTGTSLAALLLLIAIPASAQTTCKYKSPDEVEYTDAAGKTARGVIGGRKMAYNASEEAHRGFSG